LVGLGQALTLLGLGSPLIGEDDFVRFGVEFQGASEFALLRRISAPNRFEERPWRGQRFKNRKLCSQREAEREKGGKRGRAERFEANSMSGGLAPTAGSISLHHKGAEECMRPKIPIRMRRPSKVSGSISKPSNPENKAPP